MAAPRGPCPTVTRVVWDHGGVTTGPAAIMLARLRRPTRPALAPAVLGALVMVIWVAYVRPLAHFDLDVFLRAGAAVAAGRDPYPRPGSPAVYSGFAFVYPYLVALPFVPLAWLPRAGAEGLFLGLSVLALLAGCRLAGARRWRAYALVLVASCTIIGLQMGTLNAWLFAGLAALWRLRDRPAAAGPLAALLVYSKLFLLPLPLWLLLTRRYRAAAAAVAALAALVGAGQLVSPVGLQTYSGMLDALARVEAPDGLSLTGLLMNAGLGLAGATWCARAFALASLAGCWLAVRPVRAGRLAASVPDRAIPLPPAPASAAPALAVAVPAVAGTPRAAGRLDAAADGLLFAATVGAALLASPIVWSHYLLLLAVPLLVLEGGERTGALAVATGVSWLLVTPHLSTGPDVTVSALVVTLLAAAPLRDATSRLLDRHRGDQPPGGATRTSAALGVVAGLAPKAAAVGVLAVAGLQLCWSLARAHHGGDAVTGAYLATLSVLGLLAWGARQVPRAG